MNSKGMSAEVHRTTLTPFLQQFLITLALIDNTHIQCMITQLVAHPAIAEFDIHIEHGHDTIHDTLATIVEESELRAGDEPEVLCIDKLLDDQLIIIIDGTLARRLEPALVTADAMIDPHACCVDDLYLLIFVSK